MIKNKNLNISSLADNVAESNSDLIVPPVGAISSGSGEMDRLHPQFVTGFSDAEANFYVRISKKQTMKAGWTVEPIFAIRLHDKDLKVLSLIQAYFGVGKIYHHKDVNEATFRVSSIKDLPVIIDHFDNYPLLTCKLSDFILFKEVLNLVFNKEHLSQDGILKIANIKASMNTKIEVTDLPNVVAVSLPLLPSPAKVCSDPYWMAGFTSGDGCFSVSIIKSKAKLGATSWIRFILTQHNRDESLMSSFLSYFGCGKVNKDSKATYFVVQRLSDIINIIIPFFDKYSLKGVKIQDYEDFKRVAQLMNTKAHLTSEGLEQIREIKNGMNTLRKSNQIKSSPRPVTSHESGDA
jgi:hypothetical protein